MQINVNSKLSKNRIARWCKIVKSKQSKNT